jgi:hypothetical protein
MLIVTAEGIKPVQAEQRRDGFPRVMGAEPPRVTYGGSGSTRDYPEYAAKARLRGVWAIDRGDAILVRRYAEGKVVSETTQPKPEIGEDGFPINGKRCPHCAKGGKDQREELLHHGSRALEDVAWSKASRLVRQVSTEQMRHAA